MIDVDHFKRVNDTYGHLVGDRVLQAVATGIRSTLRIYDRVGRYGGEEFLIVMPINRNTQVLPVAERVRTTVGKVAVTADTGVVSVSASIGGALLRSGEKAEALVSRADAALYDAKTGGRDRSVMA